MDDYVKREDVVSALWKALYSYEDKTEKQFKEDPNLEIGEWFGHRIFVQVFHGECLGEVLAIPSEDVAVVRHGTWLWELADNGWADHICSKCGYTINTDVHVIVDYDYCPNCGADMRGGT